MKNNTFTEDYEAYKAIDAEFAAAADQAGKEAARAKFIELNERMEKKGEAYCMVYKFYEAAQERGNEYIDIRDNVRDAKELIDAFREYGIERFTFSSAWTSTVETAWQFLQNGCTLEGMVELYGDLKITLSPKREYKTAPGYLFKVN